MIESKGELLQERRVLDISYHYKLADTDTRACQGPLPHVSQPKCPIGREEPASRKHNLS